VADDQSTIFPLPVFADGSEGHVEAFVDEGNTPAVQVALPANVRLTPGEASVLADAIRSAGVESVKLAKSARAAAERFAAVGGPKHVPDF
jgi:hypothetical protein